MKPACRNRNPAAASMRQTSVSLVILIALFAIGIFVFASQYNFNPAVRVQSEALPQPSAGPVPRPGASLLRYLSAPPPAVTPLTGAERFDAQNLSDKINGKAELYLSAGFRELSAQRFAPVDAPDNWLELYVYDMASQPNAFAVYSGQQREEAEALDLCRFGYQTTNAVYCVHGPFYLEVIGSAADPALMASARSLIAAFVADNPVKQQGFDTPALFPAADQVADSIVMISANAFGFEKLDQVYIAEYTIDGQSLTAFLSKRRSPQAARELAEAYQHFLLNFGGRPVEADPARPSETMIEIFDTYESIFTLGPYLAGVHEASDPEPALVLIDRLRVQLQQAGYGNQ